MPKEDCKYWDKCYQKNEYHKQKYNHPAKNESEEASTKASQSEKAVESEVIEARNEGGEEEDEEQEPQPKNSNPNAKSEENTKTDSAILDEEPASSESVANKRKLNSVEEEGESTGYVENREEFDVTEERAQVYKNLSGKNYLAMLEKRIKISEEKEYAQLVSSNEFIRHKFLVEMPPDFYEFWKFAGEISQCSGDGDGILSFFLKQYQLKLVGPFEFLAGRFHDAKVWAPGDYLRHWRFFYDPPEFQTILVRRSTGVHYGYWRDAPDQKDKLLVARNDSKEGCKIEFIGGNLFEAFLYYINNDLPKSPFNVATEQLAKKTIKDYLAKHKLEYETLGNLKKERQGKIVTRTFHGAGIVVPYQKKTQLGYREMIVSEQELKKILNMYEKENIGEEAIMEKLHPIANAATIAMDECDFGTALEFGIDLFCSGRSELHRLASSMLFTAYGLLNRPQFIAIAKAHMEDRRRDLKLSNFE